MSESIATVQVLSNVAYLSSLGGHRGQKIWVRHELPRRLLFYTPRNPSENGVDSCNSTPRLCLSVTCFLNYTSLSFVGFHTYLNFGKDWPPEGASLNLYLSANLENAVLCLLEAPAWSTVIWKIINYFLPAILSSCRVRILWTGRCTTPCNILSETEAQQ